LLVFTSIIFFFIVLIAPVLKIVSHSQLSETYVLRVSQMCMSIALFVLSPFAFAYFVSPKIQPFLKLDVNIQWKSAGLLAVYMLLIIPFVNLLSYFNHQLVLPDGLAAVEAWMKASEAEVAHLTERILTTHTIWGLLFNIFIVAFLPAIGEELFCRGVLQRIFQDWKGVRMAIWISAIIFSTIHLQFYGFVPRLLFGVFFGYLLIWSGSLWLPILAHFVNNATAVIFYYFTKNGSHQPNIETIGTADTLWMGVLSGFVAIAGVFLLKKQLNTSDFST
jgi:membrane protease YdiL (CAAX protease family)